MIPGDWSHWLIVIAAGLVTLMTRASFIVLPSDTRVPEGLKRSLKFVGAAVLPALVLPEVLFGGLQPGASFNAIRIIAAIVALLIAWRTKNILLTLAVGMAVLWLLKWQFGVTG